MIKNQLIIAALIFLCSSSATADLPAIAQPPAHRPVEVNIGNFEIEEYELDFKPTIYVAYSKYPNGRDSIFLKHFITKDGYVDKIADYQKEVLSKINVVFVDAESVDDRREYKIPYNHSYYPLIKHSKRGDWKEFPKEHRDCFLHPLWMMEWLEYQHFIYLEEQYSEKINRMSYRKKRNWLLDREKEAFSFLVSKGINPESYHKCVTSNNYTNVFSRYFYKSFEKWDSYFYTDSNGRTKIHHYRRYKYHYFRDHDLEKIKEDFLSFSLSEKVYDQERMKPKVQPPWSTEPFPIEEERFTGKSTIKELRKELGGGTETDSVSFNIFQWFWR